MKAIRLGHLLACWCLVLFLCLTLIRVQSASRLEGLAQTGSTTSSVNASEGLAQSDTAIVSVSPENVTADVGDKFSIDVDISGVSDLYGWEFSLGWNFCLIELTSVDEGPFLNQGGDTFFNYYLNSTGDHVIVDCTLTGPIPGANGGGTLATASFYTKAVGGCTLNLYDVLLIDSQQNQISCSTVSGYGNFMSVAAAGAKMPLIC